MGLRKVSAVKWIFKKETHPASRRMSFFSAVALRRKQHVDVLDDESRLVLSIQGAGDEPDPFRTKGSPVDTDDPELRVNGSSDRSFFTIKPDRPNGSLVISHHQLSPTSESKSP